MNSDEMKTLVAARAVAEVRRQSAVNAKWVAARIQEREAARPSLWHRRLLVFAGIVLALITWGFVR